MSNSIQAILHSDSRMLSDALGLGAASAHIEVQSLLQAAIGVSRAWLLAHTSDEISTEKLSDYRDFLRRRLQGEPVAYILGEREFYGLNFMVTPATLIPRPETETLVEQALLHLPLVQTMRVADMGTGSGAIALSIAHERPDVEMVAVDLSAEALEVAAHNVKVMGLNNVRLLHSDWFSKLHGERFDLIVSNPPYVATGDKHLSQGDLRFEPVTALASGEQGMDDIERIIFQAGEYLVAGGRLLLEHGYDQSEQVRELLQDAGYSAIASASDLAGIQRVSGGLWSGRNEKNQFHVGTKGLMQ